ncbi:hypothetical protein B6I21_05100 [candidate division KSB1 bacterium 4572_119]|nr:MAG: hypothetical protein B6I21_05100 [candidate division KSB1 bacterium 4572_119]
MWTVTGLAAQETIQLEFDISFDNILEAKDYTIQFDALVDTLVNLDDGDHLDFDTENNADSWSISVDATPDYKIFLDSDKNSIYTGDVVNFSIKCENSQVIPLQNPRCRIYIDDSVPGSNLYSLDFGTGTANIQQNFIEWELPLLEPNQSETINLTLTFDQVDMMNNYNISLIATIDSVENNASLFSDNESRKQIYLDGTPNLEIKLNETENRHETFPDSTLYFTVSCENKSSPMIDDAKVFLWINENNTIYSILPGSLTISATNDSIFWNLSALGKDESSSENFQLLFNGINTHNDYNLALTAETDFPNQSDDDSTDNRSSYQVSVDATPELTIEIEEQNDKYMVEPNDILKFNLVCQNTSFSTYNSLQVQAAISGDKIYKIVSATGNIVQGEEDQISWTIPPLLMNETATVPFDLIFDNIPDVRDYTVIITGLISLPDYDFDWAQDSKQKTITTNVNVDVSIGNITCNPASPSLNTMLDYSIPVYNNGNYPARNAVLTIERPEYTDLNYYILNGSKYVFSDSSSSTGQIDLGDLEPNYDNTIQVGLRVHSFKELPSHVHNHFRLDFLSTISFEGGDDVSRSLVRDVYFDPAVADLFLDKNIVEPGELPLVVTFKSSDFGDLDIKVYNLAGEFIKTIHSGSVEKGDTYLFDWYGDNKQNMPVSSGVYFIHAYTKFYQGIKKVIVVR